MKILMIAALLLLQGANPRVQGGTITGQVVSAGAGVRIAVVAVPAPGAPNSGATALASLGEIDSAGNFRFENLPTGAYYVSARLIDSPNVSTIYFPGVESAAQARAVIVDSGVTVSGITFSLTQKVGVKVGGRLTGIPVGTPAGMFRMTLSQGQPPIGDMRSVQVPVSEDGSFEFQNILPGSYFFRTSPTAIPSVTTPIVVLDRDITSVVLALGPAILGRIVMEGGASLPGSAEAAARINSNAIPSLRVMANNQQTFVQPDGSFLWLLPAGEYKIDVMGLPYGYYIKSMSHGFADLLQTTLKVMGTPVASPVEARITLTTTRPATAPAGVKVSGHVSGLSDGEIAGAAVTMELTWTRETVPPWGDRRKGAAMVRPDGTFEFLHVPPGAYYLQVFPRESLSSAMAGIIVSGTDVAGVDVSTSPPVVTGLPTELQTQLTFRSTIFRPAPVPIPPPPTQTPLPMPKRFEIYYEVGVGDHRTANVSPGDFDAFDSEKHERVYDAQGGQVKYRAELTADEASRIYQSVVQNNILAGKSVFTDMGNISIDPFAVGRLRIDVDGKVTEFRFARTYGRVHPEDADWPRLQNVTTVIESILKEKDAKQTLPRHKMYM